MRYFGRVFRPPSEAYSLIVQATIGCSHNRCAFCDMYKEKSFTIRKVSEIVEDLRTARTEYRRIERIFLADGDALMMRTPQLLEILSHIAQLFPECERVGIYSSPKSIELKTSEELCQLRQAGLKIAYLGLESGSAEVLKRMDKGATPDAIVASGKKMQEANIDLSVTVISGLGGLEYMTEHALDSARALSSLNPKYIGLLTLLVEEGTPLADWTREGTFTPLTPVQVAEETRMLLEHIDSPGSVFRSNHASNYVSLSGTLNQDKQDMIDTLTHALEGKLGLRSEGGRRF